MNTKQEIKLTTKNKTGEKHEGSIKFMLNGRELRIYVLYWENTTKLLVYDESGAKLFERELNNPVNPYTPVLLADKIIKSIDSNKDAINDENTAKLAEKLAVMLKPVIKGRKGKKSSDNKVSAADIVRMAEEKCVFFRDELDEAYVAIKIPKTKSLMTVKVNSRKFKAILSEWVFKATHGRKVPRNEAISSAISTIEAKCLLEGEKTPLNLRVARNGGRFLYDCGTDTWRLIEVKPGTGWRYRAHSRPIFKRFPHMRQQVEPKPDATPDDFKKITKYINVRKGDEILLLSHIASFIVPEIPHPALIFTGLQGAGKTSAFKVIRAVVDPSEAPISTFPPSLKDFMVNASHSWLILLDNVGKLTNSQSDALCKAVTGDGMILRKLYTDEDENVFKFKRCVGITAIENPVVAPDLLDRSIIYELCRIPKNKRKTEEEINDEFKEDLPAIVGGLFATISQAIAVVDTVREELHELPRMADFCVWGEAIARALGYQPMDFYEAYINKIKSQKTAVLDGDVLFHLLNEYIKREGAEIRRSPTEIFKELRKIAKKEDLLGGFPKNPDWLSRRLKRLRDNLREVGIEVEFSRENNLSRKRIIHIKQTNKNQKKTKRKPKKVSIKW